MVLQIAADTFARRQRLHPGGLQHSPRPDARALQDRRRIDRSRRQHHLGIGAHLVPLAAAQERHARRAGSLEDDAVDHGARDQPHIAALHRGFQIGVRRRPAPPFPHRHVGRTEPFLPVTVIVRRRRVARRLGRGDEGVMQRVVARAAGDVKRAAGAPPGRLAAMRMFHPPEIGQHIGIAPAGRAGLLPMRIVAGMAADIDHAVDRTGPADHLAARTDKRAPAEGRFRLGKIAPVIAFHVHRIGQRRRHLDQRPGIAAAEFQHQNACGPVLAKPVGKRASGRTRSDDDIVVIPVHSATIGSAARPVKRRCFHAGLTSQTGSRHPI